MEMEVRRGDPVEGEAEGEGGRGDVEFVEFSS